MYLYENGDCDIYVLNPDGASAGPSHNYHSNTITLLDQKVWFNWRI